MAQNDQTPYADKLRDPRWQRKRLEVLQRDDWTCQLCGDQTSTLQVHHRYYVPGHEPWEYRMEALQTLCERCHRQETELRPEAERALLRMLRLVGYTTEELSSIYLALSSPPGLEGNRLWLSPAGVPADRPYGLGQLTLQNVVSFPSAWRVECPHTSITSEAPMTRRRFGLRLILALTILVAPLAGEAQQAVKVPRIGVLSLSSPSDPAMPRRLETFWQGLRALGWVEGQNITVERRYAEGDSDRLPALATELVRVPVELMVTLGLPAAIAAQEATTTIPIVMVYVSDPVRRGLVSSLAQPGGNITGLSFDTMPEIRGKQLQLLKEAAPTVSRVAILWGPRELASQAYGQAGADAARALGITLRSVQVQRAEDLARAFAVITSDPIGIHALMVAGPLGYMQRSQIADFAIQRGLPTMGAVREYVEAGGLMSYGPSLPDIHRHAAVYVDKILKGAKPADLPVEQPMKFELVINLKTAQALGLTIPPTLLFQATEVIR